MKTDRKTKQTIYKEVIVKAPSRRPWDVGDWRSALRMADYGKPKQLYDLYDDMLIDGVLYDAVDKRKKAVLNTPLIFVDGKGREVDYMSELMDTTQWEDLITWLLDARFYGRSGVEIEVDRNGLIVHHLPPKHIDLATESIILDISDQDKKVSYAGDSSITVIGKPRDYGLLLQAMPYAIYKRGGFGDWSQWLELFGMPQRVGKYNTYDPASKRLLETALEEAGSAPYVVVPKDTEIEIRDSSQTSGTSFNEFRQACNEEILITILGQTLTTISGEKGARSLGDVHKVVEEDKNKADIRFVQRILNSRVLPLFEARGVPGVAGGRFLFPEDAKEISVPELVQLATILPIPTSYLYDKYGIPIPEQDEQVAGRKVETPKHEKPEENEGEDTEEVENRDPFPTALQENAVLAEQAPKENLLKKLISSITALLNLKDDSYSIDLKKLLNEAIKEVYGGEVEVSENLFKIQNNALQQAIDKAMGDPDFGRDNKTFIEEFRYNTAVFSAFKAHAETEAFVNLLTKPDGSLRSFREFKKLALQISPKWNEQWLQTEYNTAVRAARSAVNYRNALKTKHLYPNLEYITSTAKNKRPDHLEYVGTILPIEHKWWDTHLPPSEFNCKCSVRPTNKPATSVPVDDGVPPAFQNNAGKSAEFIKLSEHPYLKDKGSPTCPECRRQGLVGKTKLRDEEAKLCQEHWLALIAKRLARYRGWEFKRTVYKSGGYLEKPEGKYQNKSEQKKNESVLEELVKYHGRKMKALPVIDDDGLKNPDAFDDTLRAFLDVKVPDDVVTKSSIHNAIREAYHQGASEVIIDGRSGVHKHTILSGLHSTLRGGRYIGIEKVTFLLPDHDIVSYDANKFRGARLGRKKKKGRR